MTLRAIVIGLVVSVVLASAGYVNDTWLFLSYIGGDQVPTHAFGLLLLGLLLVNPLLRRIGGRFRTSEIVVMLSMALMGSVIAGSSLLWTFPHPVITPLQDHATTPAWGPRGSNLIQYVPDVMMVDADPADSKEMKVVTDFLQGKGKKGRWMDPAGVPWKAWSRTLTFWFSVMSLAFVGGMCMVIVVHRQWSRREHLAYPIAVFARELVEYEDLDKPNPLLRSQPFWIGFAVAFAVLGINGYQKTWNEDFISIPFGIDATPFLDKLGDLKNVPIVNGLLDIRFFFSAIGLGYFLTSEASFSIGISSWMYALAIAPFIIAGVDMNVDFIKGGLPAYMYFGAYLGLAVMVLYLGRRFYFAVIRRAFFLPDRTGEILPREANALRLLLVCGAALTALLIWIGLHWLLAVLFVLMSGMMFLMIARVHVAMGLFVIQPNWQPVGVMLALFGGAALGPKALMILAILSMVVTVDPKISMLPLAANVFKLAEGGRLKLGRFGGVLAATIVISMVVAVLITVYVIYDIGHKGMNSQGTRWAVSVARMPHKLLDQNVRELEAQDMLAEAKEPTSVGRLLTAAFSPNALTRRFYYAVAIGAALVIGCYLLRLLLPRWPLHPLVFLVWGTSFVNVYGPSFLMAWFLKTIITKYGGQPSYRKAKPFFVGLVAGEFAVAIILALANVIYYCIFKEQPGDSFLVRE